MLLKSEIRRRAITALFGNGVSGTGEKDKKICDRKIRDQVCRSHLFVSNIFVVLEFNAVEIGLELNIAEAGDQAVNDCRKARSTLGTSLDCVTGTVLERYS